MHSSSFRRVPHKPRAACTLYTSPLASATLPVYEQLSITWDPTCIAIGADTIDLYLTVTESAALGAVAVHEWTGIQYSAGTLDTQLNPAWWNASTGAGSVQAQLAMTASGSPVWDTAAPSGPIFTITYNGSYPSVTATASSPVYTGPSVESVANLYSSGFGSSKLAAAVAVPVIVVVALVLSYVAWNRWKKRPDKKRWSAVIDQRMSMISQGTWAPPRPSTSSRPGSHYSQARPSSHYSQLSAPGLRPDSHYSPSHRPSGSITRSPLSNSTDGRPTSSYSSPLAAGSIRSSEGRPHSSYSVGGGPRPPPPAEMRQIGSGERVSHVSHVSFASDRVAPPNGGHGHSPSGSTLRSIGVGAHNSHHSVDSTSVYGRPLPRSGSTREDLSPLALSGGGGSPSHAPRKPSHLATASNTSSLRDVDFPALAIIRDPSITFPPASPDPTTGDAGAASSPFEDPSPARPQKAKTGPMRPHMPMAQRSSILSPDELLTRYAVKREPSMRQLKKPDTVGTSSGGRWAKLLGGFRRKDKTLPDSQEQKEVQEPVISDEKEEQELVVSDEKEEQELPVSDKTHEQERPLSDGKEVDEEQEKEKSPFEDVGKEEKEEQDDDDTDDDTDDDEYDDAESYGHAL